MKAFLFTTFVLFSSHFVQGGNINGEPPVKVRIELSDTIYTGQKAIPIVLKIENTTSETLSIRNPAYWGNAYPYMKREKQTTFVPGIKVKINPKVFQDIIQIEGNETLSIKFGFTLDEIFDLDNCPIGKYEIYFKLDPDGKTSIKSDVFTFYKQ